MEHIELQRPHGFLVWRGKQTAIAIDSAKALPKEAAIVSDSEAFGIASLGDPVQVSLSEFEKDSWQDQHCLTPDERRLLYPEAKAMNIYRIAEFKRFHTPKVFEGGELKDPETLTKEESEMIERAKGLPKTIILDEEAVTFDGKNFVATHAKNEIEKVLKATYQTDISEKANGPLPLSLYQLALVRIPNMQVKKNTSVKQEDNDMPWEIQERDGRQCVIKVDDGEVEGCHNTLEEAQAQLAALNIAEAESSKEMTLQQRVDFIRQQFIERFNSGNELVRVWTIDIDETFVIADDDGKLFKVPFVQGGEDLTFVAPENWIPVEVAYIEKAIETEKEGLLDKVKSVTKAAIDKVTPKKEKFIFDKDHGLATKTVNGQSWHFTWSTNAFKDREDEIFTTKALETYVLESEEKEDKGTFDFWHIPGTDFAKKEWQGVIGRFLVEAGPYLDNELGKSAKEFFSKHSEGHSEIAPEGWGASPMYRFLSEDRKEDGIYNWLWVTKTSTLPRAAAANIWTEGKQIMLTEEQRKAAVTIFGKETVEALEAEGLKKTEDLEGQGIEHKSNSEEKPVEVDLDGIAEAVKELITVDITPISEEIGLLADSIKTLSSRIEDLEKQKSLEEQTELPRYVVSLTRPSAATETELKENDELLQKKPVSKSTDQAIADAFFSGN
jgi:hypothetical protein